MAMACIPRRGTAGTFALQGVQWLLLATVLCTLFRYSSAAPQRECSYTWECQGMYSGADDCKNNLGGICYCGADPCSCHDGVQNRGEEGADCGGPCPPCAVRPTPTVEPTLTVEPTPTVQPTLTISPERECSYTWECQAQYAGATDCKNYLGGICYCGDKECRLNEYQPTPVVPEPVYPQPVVPGPSGPAPMLDEWGMNVLKQFGWMFNAGVSDEFNQSPGQATPPDPTKWHQGFINAWKGRRRSLWDPSNGYTKNGNLVLEVRPKDCPNHSAGIVSSKERMGLGYYEVRAKASEQLLASSFWFYADLPGQGGFEIDVYEHFPNEWHPKGAGLMKTNIHHFYRINGENVDQIDRYGGPVPMPNGALVTDWQTYGVLREPNGLHFYANGVKLRTIWKKDVPVASWPGDKDINCILDTEIYDWQDGTCNCLPTCTYSSYMVDYFRAWN